MLKMQVDLMNYLNSIGDRGSHYYDCGAGVLLHIWWSRRGWEMGFVEIEKMPINQNGLPEEED